MHAIYHVSEDLSVGFNVRGSAPLNFAIQLVNGNFLRLSSLREGYPGRFTWGLHISHALLVRSREIRSSTTERLVSTRSNREALMIRNLADVEGKRKVVISLSQCLAHFYAVSQTNPDLDPV